MAKEGRKNTYDRIVDASLELFNQEGERVISTNHIASHLSISPGNLYYHFRNKDEIILQLFKRYRHELLHYLDKIDVLPTPKSMVDFIAGIFDIMWRYRFFFADVNTLLERSSELSGEHHEFTREEVTPRLLKQFHNAVQKGFLDMDSLDMSGILSNMWLIGKFWYVHDRALHPHWDGEESKIRGVYQLMGLMRPFVTAPFREEFDQELLKYAGAQTYVPAQ